MKAVILFLPAIDPGVSETGDLSFDGALGFVFLVNVILNFLPYIFTAIGFYTVAKRRGIRYPWLAWIPVADLWILGSISDDYYLRVKGKKKNFRKLLIGMVGAIAAVFLIFLLMMNFVHGSSFVFYMMGYLCLTYGLVGVLLVIRFTALSVFYRSCYSKKESLYIILSILVNILEPVLIFRCRNWDIGMYEEKWRKEGVSQNL